MAKATRIGLVIMALMIAAFIAGWSMHMQYVPVACSHQEDGTLELCGDVRQYDYRDGNRDGHGQWYHR